MLGKELIEICKQYPDFEVTVVTSEVKDGKYSATTLENLSVADIAHDSKRLVLTGEKKE